jgi:hypothetical protein
MADLEDLSEFLQRSESFCLNEQSQHNIDHMLKADDSCFLESDSDEYELQEPSKKFI